MGVSTNGQICYGVMFGDGYEFPWDEEGLEEWWLDVVCAYKPSVEIYENGRYIGGVKPGQGIIDAYYAERRAFKAAHPLPFENVNYCSGDYPMYILAIKRTCLNSNRGYPSAFNPAELTVTDEEKASLLEFCQTYNLEFQGEPGWWLSSYWG